jgi:hypothetical protein
MPATSTDPLAHAIDAHAADLLARVEDLRRAAAGSDRSRRDLAGVLLNE